MVMLVSYPSPSTKYNPYKKNGLESVIGDPFSGAKTIKHDDYSSADFDKLTNSLFHPWDKTTALARQASGDLKGWPTFDKKGQPKLGMIRNQGDGYQYDYYDIYFNEYEIADAAKKQLAFDTVVDWAGHCEAGDKKGTRAFEVQTWHTDGQNQGPHLRVVVSRVLYEGTRENHRLASALLGASKSEINDDIAALGKKLADAGFTNFERAGRDANNAIVNPIAPFSRSTESVVQMAALVNQAQPGENINDVLARADQVLAEQAEQEPILAALAGVGASSGSGTTNNADMFRAAQAAAQEKMRAATADFLRFGAAIKLEQDFARRDAEADAFERERDDLNFNVKGMAEQVKADLTAIAPEFSTAVENLTPTAVVKAGLVKHVEIETQLTDQLTTTQQALNRTTQEVIDAGMAIISPLEDSAVAEIQGANLPEKITSLHGLYAGQLRAAETEWIAEIEGKDQVIAATTAELTTVKSDIAQGVDILRSANPELFEGNPDLEKSIRALMEAAANASTAQKEKVVEVEAKNEELEERNDALSKRTQKLESDNERLTREKAQAEQKLKEMSAQLDEKVQKVQELTRAEEVIRGIIKPKLRDMDNFASATVEEAVTSLTDKYESVVKDRDLAKGEVTYLNKTVEEQRKQIADLNTKIDSQAQKHQEQMDAMRVEYRQEIAQAIGAQAGQATQGNVPTPSVGATKQGPTQGTTNEGPVKPKPERGIDE